MVQKRTCVGIPGTTARMVAPGGTAAVREGAEQADASDSKQPRVAAITRSRRALIGGL
jgi:hypothetical protein